jgi:hypothetical protein
MQYEAKPAIVIHQEEPRLTSFAQVSKLRLYKVIFIYRDRVFDLDIPAYTVDEAFHVIEFQYSGCKITSVRVIG